MKSVRWVFTVREVCHVAGATPYKSEGGVKFSDHHIQSLLAMIDRTCPDLPPRSEETLRNNVYERQRKANEIRNRLEQELAKAHIEAKFAWDKGGYGRSDEKMYLPPYPSGAVALGFRCGFSRWFFPCSAGNPTYPFTWTG